MVELRLAIIAPQLCGDAFHKNALATFYKLLAIVWAEGVAGA